jgi:glycosyltransferase involved in cell wall biosynthesis
VKPIGHGIDADVFRPATQSAKRGAHQPTIVSVGRISPIKHLEVLIEAADILINRRNVDDLAVILTGAPPNRGQGWYLNKLKQLTHERHLESHVTFTGKVPYQEIVSLYQKSDIFVSASKSGVDKVVLEAMACETPVVVSDPVFKPILETHAERLMYPDGDAQTLANRLETLLEMSDTKRRAIGKDLRCIIEGSYTVEALMDELLRIFEEIS